MTTRTDPTVPLAAAVKGARSLGLPSANVSVHALEAAIAEAGELRKRVEQLTDRIIGASDNRADADDLRRENEELRKTLADGASSETVIAQLREWTAEGRHEYEPGALQIAMPVRTACKIIEELDRLRQQNTDKDQANSDLYAANIELRAKLAPQPSAEPVHFTTTGSVSVCGRRASHLPKGVAFTLAFDPDDNAIDCRDCCLYLKGLRAAPTSAGSPR